jgi:hypothetical protein
MSRLTEAQQAAALEAIAKITYFGEEECVALLECMQLKIKGSYAKGAWSNTADDALDNLLADLKYEKGEAKRFEESEREELPYMPSTVGLTDQPSWRAV